MRLRFVVLLPIALGIITSCGGIEKSNPTPQPAASSGNGTGTTALPPGPTIDISEEIPQEDSDGMVAFDPTKGHVPFPSNFMFAGSTDGTLNIPMDDPTDRFSPYYSLNASDGFSTTGPINIRFSHPIAPESIVLGGNVRIFEAIVDPLTQAPVTIVRELDGTEIAASTSPINPTKLMIQPLKPLTASNLQRTTGYVVVVTNGLVSAFGKPFVPNPTFLRMQGSQPITPETLPGAFDQSHYTTLEATRQYINAQEALIKSAVNIDSSSILMSFTFSTQSTVDVLAGTASQLAAVPYTVLDTGLNTAVFGGAANSQIHTGTMTVPYFSEIPSAENPLAAITGHWTNDNGLVTLFNPVAKKNADVEIPFILAIPNGIPKPAQGWPIAIFQHGVGLDRSAVLPIVNSFAQAGIAVIAIDLPLHGITPSALSEIPLNLYPGNTFYNQPIERHFHTDVLDATGAFVPSGDGKPDPSGDHFANLRSLVTGRDNARQATLDLITLAKTVKTMDIDGDQTIDFNPALVHLVGHSLGGIIAVMTSAISDEFATAVFANPGATGGAKILDASPYFQPRIKAALEASGVIKGSEQYQVFLDFAEIAAGPTDPINFSQAASLARPTLMIEMVGNPDANIMPDQYVPNTATNQSPYNNMVSEISPLVGTEPLIANMNLTNITNIYQDLTGVRGVSRFVTGWHGSILDPKDDLASTIELHGQIISFIVSQGTTVQVGDAGLLKQ